MKSLSVQCSTNWCDVDICPSVLQIFLDIVIARLPANCKKALVFSVTPRVLKFSSDDRKLKASIQNDTSWLGDGDSCEFSHTSSLEILPGRSETESVDTELFIYERWKWKWMKGFFFVFPTSWTFSYNHHWMDKPKRTYFSGHWGALWFSLSFKNRCLSWK